MRIAGTRADGTHSFGYSVSPFLFLRGVLPKADIPMRGESARAKSPPLGVRFCRTRDYWHGSSAGGPGSGSAWLRNASTQ